MRIRNPLGKDVTDLVILGAVIAGGYLALKYLMPALESSLANNQMGGEDFGTPAATANDSTWSS